MTKGQNMEPKMMHAVSRGEYEDYRVMCVTSDLGLAERVRDAYNADPETYDTAELTVLPYVDYEPAKITIWRTQIEIFDNGTTKNLVVNSTEEWPFDDVYGWYGDLANWRWVRAPMYNDKGGRLEVTGTDQDRVIEVREQMTFELLHNTELRMKFEAHR